MKRPLQFRMILFWVLFLAVAITLLSGLAMTYCARIGAPVTVTAALDDATEQPLRYLRIHLDQQDPEEPLFRARVLLHIQDLEGDIPSEVELTRSAGRKYLPSRVRVPLRLIRDTYSSPQVEISLIPLSGGHWQFPFDSADFDFRISIEPPMPVTILRFVNRVPGFLLDANSVHFSQENEGEFRVQAHLQRNRFTQILFLLLATASLVFIIFILSLDAVEQVGMASASYFFSLWSIRSIVSSQMATFPTLLDYWIVVMASLLLAGLLLKVVLRPRAP